MPDYSSVEETNFMPDIIYFNAEKANIIMICKGGAVK